MRLQTARTRLYTSVHVSVLFSDTERKSAGRKLYNWLCGFDNRPRPKLTPEEKEAIKRKMTSLEESPYAARLTTILAVTTAIVTTFLLGFFY